MEPAAANGRPAELKQSGRKGVDEGMPAEPHSLPDPAAAACAHKKKNFHRSSYKLNFRT